VQYADVVVDAKTDLTRDTFTYAIPPEILPQVSPGVAVLVPLRGRRTEGIVLSLTRHAPAIRSGRILPIFKTLSRGIVLDESLLELGGLLSGYYLSPLSRSLFSMIPPLPRSEFSGYRPQPRRKTKRRTALYSVDGRALERWRAYAKLATRALSNRQNVLLLFPSRDIAERFGKTLTSPHGFLFAEDTPKERWKHWQDIAQGKHKIVIGTRGAIFAPIPNLRIIIIDDESNDLYKEERSPRFDARTVALLRANLSGATVVFGDLYLSTRARMLGKISRVKVGQSDKVETRIIDMRGNPSLFAEKTLSLFAGTKRVVVFVPRKGQGTTFLCRDCGTVIRCPRCNLPFTVYPTNLRCHHCGYREPLPSRCPTCHGVNFRSQGMGIERVAEELRRLFPKKITAVLDEQRPDLPARWDIVVATQKVLFTETKADSVIVMGADAMMNLPDFDALEETFRTLQALKGRASENFIIQTVIPEHRLFARLSDPDRFIKEDLAERRRWSLPPAVQYVRILFTHKDSEAAAKRLTELKGTITETLPGIAIQGPAPAFIEKERNLFRWHIILALPIDSLKIKKRLRKLIPIDVTVDVDPVTIL
jgi:primosomal protein N' (replication factor Y)